jgi:transglutaminase-like putative cysteine protease
VSWQPRGPPATQPHEYIRGGTTKILTLFHPATGQVRLQSAARGTNAVLHPWLRERLSAILAELPPPAPYLYNPDQDQVGSAGAGSTHAWAEVLCPGAGWITFDPTNRSVGGFNLIPVAVARDIRQVMPVAGSFVGMTDAFQGMWVEVRVTSEPIP